MLFIYQWSTPLKLTIAVVALMVFALVLQAIYEKAQSLVTPFSSVVSGPAIGDVYGDGLNEIVSGSQDSFLYVFPWVWEEGGSL